MVDSCAGDAWLTSIVNFFIFYLYLLIVFVLRRLQLEACGLNLFFCRPSILLQIYHICLHIFQSLDCLRPFAQRALRRAQRLVVKMFC